MTEQLLIRHCTSRDATVLRDLRLEALRDTPDAFGSTFDVASTWPDERWVTMAADWNFYLGYHAGRPAGIASGGWNERYPDTHWLFGMFVTRSARGTGLAGALVDAVAEWVRAQGGESLYLHVTSTVAPARRFYEKVGFIATGEVITMDRDPSQQLITMVKHLES